MWYGTVVGANGGGGCCFPVVRAVVCGGEARDVPWGLGPRRARVSSQEFRHSPLQAIGKSGAHAGSLCILNIGYVGGDLFSHSVSYPFVLLWMFFVLQKLLCFLRFHLLIVCLRPLLLMFSSESCLLCQ